MKNTKFNIFFSPSGKKGSFVSGTTVLQAAQELGVSIESVCGGKGVCKKCIIKPQLGKFDKYCISSSKKSLSELSSRERKFFDLESKRKDCRLSCQTKIMGDLVIDVPESSLINNPVVRKKVETKNILINPTLFKVFLKVDEPDINNPSGDLERLQKSFSEKFNDKPLFSNLYINKKLQKILRKGNWKVTCAIYKNNKNNFYEILEIWPNYYEDDFYGIAIDLGSTTIAGNICNLRTGDIISSKGIMNPQIKYGEDLMSRVSFSMMNTQGQKRLTKSVIKGVNELIKLLIKESNIKKKIILDIVVVANPVMHHLFLGLDPFELGQAPFALTTANSIDINASEVGINLNKNSKLFIPPCIAGHVGADATSVAIAEKPKLTDETFLIIDVGTNAEIFIGNKEKVFVCSSPTGPAFEGAQILNGQRAAPGAIEKVIIDPYTKEPKFKIIGCDLWSNEPKFSDGDIQRKITGICGSGIIEVIAEMRTSGILDSAGRIGSFEQTGSKRCIKNNRTQAYVLFEDKENNKKILITNEDVRAIQLAKAALYSGVKLLMDKMNVKKVDKIILAGAFGAHISAKHAMILGMIPDCKLKNIHSAGNAAGTGAIIALLNKNTRTEMEKMVKNICKIETATSKNFQDYFMYASNIPHQKDQFHELKKIVHLPEVNFNSRSKRNKFRKRLLKI